MSSARPDSTSVLFSRSDTPLCSGVCGAVKFCWILLALEICSNAVITLALWLTVSLPLLEVYSPPESLLSFSIVNPMSFVHSMNLMYSFLASDLLVMKLT